MHTEQNDRYALYVLAAADIRFLYSYRFNYQKTCHIYLLPVLGTTFGFSNLKSIHFRLKGLSAQEFSYNDTVSVRIRYLDKNNYHQPTFSLLVEMNRKLNQFCATLDGSYDRHLMGNISTLEITNFCGVGQYSVQGILMFTLLPYHLKGIGSHMKLKYYFSLFYENNCNNSHTHSDQVTLNYVAQSTAVDTSEMHVVAHDTSFLIDYHKYGISNCTTMKIIYHCQMYQLLFSGQLVKDGTFLLQVVLYTGDIVSSYTCIIKL